MDKKGGQGRARFFLSLKWKVILFLGLVLLITDLVIILYADSRARERFR